MIDFLKYTKFVNAVTSNESKYGGHFKDRIRELDSKDFSSHRALTAALGLCAESGEFTEIVKKILFQGKEITPELREKLIKELGDVAWYWVNACTALDISPYEVIQRNMDKLLERFPEDSFSVERSENRSKNDT